MSTDIALLFWTPPEQCEEAFYQIGLRLLRATCSPNLWIKEDCVPAEEAAQRLRQLLDTQAFDELGRLNAGMYFRSPYGEEIGLGLNLKKQRCSEHPRRFYAWIGLRSLLTTFDDQESGFYLYPQNANQLLGRSYIKPKHEELWYAAWRAAENLETLLLAGIDADEGEVPIAHATVRWDETSWEGPFRARMIYHADVAEFAQDFLRIFLEARSEWWPYDATYARQPSLVIDDAIAQGLMLPDDGMCITERDNCFESPNVPGELSAFVRFLDRDRAERIAKADGTTVERLLQAAASQTRNITLRPVKGGGYLVETHLFNNLSEFYVCLGLLLDTETAEAGH